MKYSRLEAGVENSKLSVYQLRGGRERERGKGKVGMHKLVISLLLRCAQEKA